jgi:hypothetical protein
MFPVSDTRSRIRHTDSYNVIFELSTDAKDLLGNENIPESLVRLISEEIMYKSEWAASVMVLRLSEISS